MPRRQTFFQLLTDGDVEALLPMDMMIDAMEGALRRVSTGGAVQPMRTVIPIGQEFFAVMPVHIPSPAARGAKLVTAFSSNAALDLPTHLATVLLFSPETGALLAVLGGNYITAARTAAVSAVSADLLAIFKSLQLAVEDVVAADLAYRRAVAQEVGRELEL